MQIGFIGAGKVGFSLGRYFAGKGLELSGYYSRNSDSALEAANFTKTKKYDCVTDLVGDSEVLFLTVPDDQIKNVWEEIRELPICGKCIVHCSGCLSSAVFSEIDRTGGYGYSIHPLFAINDKLRSYRELSHALFTLEGNEKYLPEFMRLLESCGNPVQIIAREAKVKYHAAAVFASNLMVGLAKSAVDILKECGFSEENAQCALNPLMAVNMENIVKQGVKAALSGPVERNDAGTIQGHMDRLGGQEREIYRLLSLEVVEIAQEKHQDRDYSKIKECLEA